MTSVNKHGGAHTARLAAAFCHAWRLYCLTAPGYFVRCFLGFRTLHPHPFGCIYYSFGALSLRKGSACVHSGTTRRVVVRDFDLLVKCASLIGFPTYIVIGRDFSYCSLALTAIIPVFRTGKHSPNFVLLSSTGSNIITLARLG